MSFYSLPPTSADSGLNRFIARLMGGMVWATLAAMGLVFAFSLAIWLLAMTVVGLVASLFTGRPAAVTVLWRRYREMTRQHWPRQRPGSATPRADAADVTGASVPTQVQDVRWREVPGARGAEPPSAS